MSKRSIDKIEKKYQSLFKYISFIGKSKNYGPKDFTQQYSFHLYEKLPIDDSNLTLFLEYRKSSGYGDLLSGYKTTQLFKKYFRKANIEIVTDDPDLVLKHGDTYLKNIKHVNHVDDFEKEVLWYKKLFPETKIILITIALDSQIDKSILYKHGIKNIYIDEYNGWRAGQQIASTKGHYDEYLIPGFGLNYESNIASCGIHILSDKKEETPTTPYYFAYASPAGESTAQNDCIPYLYIYVMSLIHLKKTKIKFEIVCSDLMRHLNTFKYLLEGKHTELSCLNPMLKEFTDCSKLLCDEKEKKLDFDLTPFGLMDKINDIEIHIHKFLPHEQMLEKIKNSLSPILTTGDQSLAEAISYDKIFFYQIHSWKSNLISKFKDYCKYQLGEKNVFLQFIELVTSNYTYNVYYSIPYQHNASYLREVIQLISLFLNDNTLPILATQINKHIKEQFNIKSSVISIVKKSLIDNKRLDKSINRLFDDIVHSKSKKDKIIKRYRNIKQSIVDEEENKRVSKKMKIA